MDPSDGSFDGSNDIPPEGALLGDILEEAGCGSDSWRLFEALICCLGPHFWILHTAPLVVPMMANQKVHCLETHLRRPDVGPTCRAFLRTS